MCVVGSAFFAAVDVTVAVDPEPVVEHAKNPVVWEAGTVVDAGDTLTTRTIKNHANEFILLTMSVTSSSNQRLYSSTTNSPPDPLQPPSNRPLQTLLTQSQAPQKHFDSISTLAQ